MTGMKSKSSEWAHPGARLRKTQQLSEAADPITALRVLEPTPGQHSMC